MSEPKRKPSPECHCPCVCVSKTWPLLWLRLLHDVISCKIFKDQSEKVGDEGSLDGLTFKFSFIC